MAWTRVLAVAALLSLACSAAPIMDQSFIDLDAGVSTAPAPAPAPAAASSSTTSTASATETSTFPAFEKLKESIKTSLATMASQIKTEKEARQADQVKAAAAVATLQTKLSNTVQERSKADAALKEADDGIKTLVTALQKKTIADITAVKADTAKEDAAIATVSRANSANAAASTGAIKNLASTTSTKVGEAESVVLKKEDKVAKDAKGTEKAVDGQLTGMKKGLAAEQAADTKKMSDQSAAVTVQMAKLASVKADVKKMSEAAAAGAAPAGAPAVTIAPPSRR